MELALKPLKRIALASAAASLAVLVTTYYSLPGLFKEPLVQLNRGLSGLSAKTVPIADHEVHYLEGGTGEAVVLLHGIFAEKDHWVDFARPLSERYRIVALDLPGFGQSGRHDKLAYDYEAQTTRLKEFLDALGIRRAHLAGNSMGGTIAALFAIRHPDRVASVAFIGAPHGIRTPQPSEADDLIDSGRIPLIARDEAEFEQVLGRLFAERPLLPYPILHAARNEALQRAESNEGIWQAHVKDRFLLDERIGELRVPAVAWWGSGDRIFDVSGADVLQARLKDGLVRVLPGVGHLPMMEVPAEMARMYGDFLVALSLHGTVQARASRASGLY